MRRVLFLTYTMPPYGGAGAHASTHFVKHLRAFGYEPIVVTVDGEAWGRDPLRSGPDPSFLRELPDDLHIYRTPAFQPFGLLRRLKQLKLLWLYHFFVRPEERLPWSLGAIPTALRAARKHNVDLVFTVTVQAWSLSLAGLVLKALLRKPWVLHSEDPWTQWPMGVWPTRLHYWLEERLEGVVLGATDAINMVWASYRDEVAAQHPSLSDKPISWIPCGYDEEDFAGRRRQPRKAPADEMVILHSGVFYDRWGKTGEGGGGLLRKAYGQTMGRLRYVPFDVDRSVHSPRFLLAALAKLAVEKPDVGRRIRVQFTGKPDPALDDEIHRLGLGSQVRQVGYLEREEYLDALCRADAMFFSMSRFRDGRRMGWLTLKLYEYLATGRPVLAAASACDAAEILRRAGTGLVVEPDDVDGLAAALLGMYRAHLQGSEQFRPDWAYIRTFEWKHLAGRLACLFDDVLGAQLRPGRVRGGTRAIASATQDSFPKVTSSAPDR